MAGLHLTIKGSALAKYSADLSAEQEYFCVEQDLIGSTSPSAPPQEIAAGRYRYDFEHRLPRNIPYTSEGIHGCVKYFVCATLDIPWELNDVKITRPFIVKRYEDLNYMSGMREEREVRTVKEVDTPSWIFWKAASGLVSVRAKIPHCGYAPGEVIKIDIEINNQSTVDIENVIVSLRNTCLYMVQTPWTKLDKITNLTMAELTAQGVKAGYTAKIKESLHVPESTPNSSVMFCNVYQITYHVHISIKFHRWNNSIELNIPVYIGSVALHPEEQEIERFPPMWPPSLNIRDVHAEEDIPTEAGREIKD